jgi:hypothetical protein
MKIKQFGLVSEYVFLEYFFVLHIGIVKIPILFIPGKHLGLADEIEIHVVDRLSNFVLRHHDKIFFIYRRNKA